MINVSKEYRERIQNNRKFLVQVDITLSNGETLDVSDDVMQGGFRFTDSVSASGTFQVGGVLINSLMVIIDNLDEQYSQYDFTYATIRPKIGLVLSNTTEYMNKGVFTVDKPQSVGSTIILTCLDNMYKLDTPFSEVALTFPTTTLNLLQTVCTHCGVYLSTSTFLNDDLIIPTRPSDEATSCREIVSYIAQISGNFARCNKDGALELKWYDFGAFEAEDSLDGGIFDSTTEASYQTGGDADGGNFTDYNSGDSVNGGTFLNMGRYHHLYDHMSTPTISTDDITITGVQVKAYTTQETSSEVVLVGSTGYVIEISNPLIQEGMASQIANSVGQKIVGMKFRPMSINVLSDPSIEAGDVAMVSDRKRNSYQTVITSINFTSGSSEQITCDAETPSERENKRPSNETKILIEARKNTRKEISQYDIVVQQFTNLITNGFGLFDTKVLDDNGGAIYYMHDKKNMDESSVRWFMTSNGMIEQNRVNGVWVTVSGTDKNGNALYNVLTARGIVADWIVAGGTIKGCRIETNTGKIGPYDIGTDGLTSDTMEIYNDGEYPLIWMKKPATGSNDEGMATANYEPSVLLFQNIENGIKTEILLMAREALDTGEAGFLEIKKTDISTGLLLSRKIIGDDGFEMKKYTNGNISESMTLNYIGITFSNNAASKTASVWYDKAEDELNIQATNVRINGVLQ